ncbi:hypothetical protein LSH36_6g02052 [Paralvinella palmiformis]|uniref:Chibby n=1 Tax=Paralvinella palmiformis TaxID=53620 RepID=A0AAD9KEM4_9ANNE|nr:hypothetical protein LSH36_6g02052 [Paralvinella palmiformis]
MPLFGSAFSPKKGQPRKATSLSNLNLDETERQIEFGLDYSPVKLRLSPHEMIFADGMWIAESGGGGGASQKDLLKTKRENQQLREENNLLKIKVELLLDMLSEKTAEIHLQENELDHMKKLAKRR